MRFLLLVLLLANHLAHAKVEPPNYDFSMDTLADFFPGKEVAAIETKYGKPGVLRDDGKTKMLRFMVAQIRYVFPIIVQVSEGKVVDMHAQLPSYFLHDIFHHSLIKRWGKQQTYTRVDEEAFYQWQNDELVMAYGASCTITCFPTYFNVQLPKQKAPPGLVSIVELLSSNLKHSPGQTRP